jgi:hypothetical protein
MNQGTKQTSLCMYNMKNTLWASLLRLAYLDKIWLEEDHIKPEELWLRVASTNELLNFTLNIKTSGLGRTWKKTVQLGEEACNAFANANMHPFPEQEVNQRSHCSNYPRTLDRGHDLGLQTP